MNGSNHALGSHRINDFEKNGLPKSTFNIVWQCRTPRVIYFFANTSQSIILFYFIWVGGLHNL